MTGTNSMYLTNTNNRNTLTRYGLYICFCMLCGVPAAAHSEQWNFEPVITVTGEYDDNTELTTNDPAKIDSTAFILDANGRFVRRAQSSEVRFAPRVRSKTYSENSYENTADVFVDFFAGRTLERTDYGLQARYAQEDVLTAELDDPDFDNPDVNRPVNLDTGQIRIGSERESLIFSPFFSHEWTETVGFGFDADYVDVTYDQTDQTFTDFTDASLGTELTFRVSDRSTWSIRAFGSEYEAEAGTARSKSQSVGAGLEFRHEFSPTMDGRVSVGYEDIDSDLTSGGVTVSDSNGVTVFSAGITRQGDISRVVVDASQTVDPGGTGFLQERTQLRFRYTRQLSPKVYVNFNARIQTTEEVSPDLISPIDRDYQRYGVGLEWRLSQIWSLRGDYAFTAQQFDETNGYAESNKASISFVYDPARRR